MEVKGTAVKTVPDFVKSKYPDQYDNWISTLSIKSKEIMQSQILSTNWYSVEDALTEPMNKLAEVLSQDINDIAWEMGRYSSEIALKGVYKIFVRIASPAFIIGRAANMLETYYRPSRINLQERQSNKIVLEFVNFLKADHMIMQRIAGWSYNTFTAVKTKNVKTELKDVPGKGENFTTLLIITWE